MAGLSCVMATSSSWLVQLAGGDEAVQRQEVVGGSEPPCHADTWLPSLVVSQRQSAPADELSGVIDKLLSLVVSQKTSCSFCRCLRGNPFLLTSSQSL